MKQAAEIEDLEIGTITEAEDEFIEQIPSFIVLEIETGNLKSGYDFDANYYHISSAIRKAVQIQKNEEQ